MLDLRALLFLRDMDFQYQRNAVKRITEWRRYYRIAPPVRVLTLGLAASTSAAIASDSSSPRPRKPAITVSWFCAGCFWLTFPCRTNG